MGQKKPVKDPPPEGGELDYPLKGDEVALTDTTLRDVIPSQDGIQSTHSKHQAIRSWHDLRMVSPGDRNIEAYCTSIGYRPLKISSTNVPSEKQNDSGLRPDLLSFTAPLCQNARPSACFASGGPVPGGHMFRNPCIC